MKRLITFIILALFVTISVIANDQFTLIAEIDSVTSDSAVLTYRILIDNQFKNVKYTSEIKLGRFQFKGELKEPIDAQLKIGEIRIALYIEPAKMELYISKSNPDEFILKGSKIQEEVDQFTQNSKDLYDVAIRINEQVEKISQKIEITTETDPIYKKLLEERKLMSSQSDSIFALVVKKRITYIKSHPNSFQSVVDKSFVNLLKLQLITGDSARVLFDNLAEKVRLSTSGTETDLYIKTKENKGIVIGIMAPDFRTPDVNGKIINLIDFREKSFVLLDFWASWCVPCLKGLPHVKELYTKYHDKGLEIISVSVDNSKMEWLSAIKNHNLASWHNVLYVQDLDKSLQGFINKEDVREKYPINGIPRYILIDKTGKIIGKWEGYSFENEKKQDELFKIVFGK
jgi:thiol-disulfide isomerase/thioredoxin